MDIDRTDDGKGSNSDEIDAKSFAFFGKKKEERNVISTLLARDAKEYFMNHQERGRAIIFNQKNFEKKLNLSIREGTDKDRDDLKDALSGLGFSVSEYQDSTLSEIQTIVEAASQEDHSKRDSFVIAILTHGESGGILYASDLSFRADLKIWEPFRADLCPSLAGKPKIFIVQACQGKGVEIGTKMAHRTEHDSKSIANNSYTIPNKADFLVVFSSVPGYYAWRNTTTGSWFIQALVQVLKTHGADMELLAMMTTVARSVALDCESISVHPTMHARKQVPFITSTLLREVYFKPKIEPVESGEIK